MRISFDLDDTLILGNNIPQKDKKRKLIIGEHLRDGAIELLKMLNKNHELFIYTTSYRSPILVKLAFRLKGIKIKTVINESIHRRILKEYNFEILPSKYPPHFNIDIHIDDSLEVIEEGKKYGFEVIQISPSEKNWSNRILKTIKML
jgi:hypothetical protein